MAIPLNIKPRRDIYTEDRSFVGFTDGDRDILAAKDAARSITPVWLKDRIQDAISENNTDKLDAITANQEYGIPGVLQFEGAVSRGQAQRRNLETRKRQRLNQLISDASRTEDLGRKLKNFGIGFAVQAIDPINYIPTTRILKFHKLMKNGSRIGKLYANPAARAAVDGAIGNAIAIPFIKQNFEDVGMDYTYADGLTDIALGIGIGGTVGSVTRAFRARSLKIKKAELKNKLAVGRAYKSLDTQLSSDARDAVDNYVQMKESLRQAPNPDEMIAIAKAYDGMTPYKQGNTGNIFTSETVLRSEFAGLTPEQRSIVNAKANTDLLFGRGIDSDNVFKTKKSQLPKGLQNIRTKLGSKEGSISVEELAVALDREVADIRAEVSELLKLRKVSKSKTLTSDQALDVFDSLEKVGTDENLLPRLESLQNELRIAERLSESDPKAFEKEFKKLANEFKDSGFRLKDLDGLPSEVKARAHKLMKTLQESNGTKVQVADALDGDEFAIRELFDQRLFNKEIKETFDQTAALNTVEQILQKQDDGFAESNIVGRAFETDVTGNVSTRFIDEKTKLMEANLDEKTLDVLNKELKAEEVKTDGMSKGIDEAINCATRVAA